MCNVLLPHKICILFTNLNLKLQTISHYNNLVFTVQARTQQGAQRARAPPPPPPLATVYSTVEYYDLPWHKRRRNINEHANVVQYKFHVKNAINSLYILSISWPEV